MRGYAVALVITCHLAFAFPGLPYPVYRLATMGWHGVQLFFLASALTLLMSWHYDTGRVDRARLTSFYLRRFFRIAPAYYAAAWLYYVLTPPPGGLDPLQLVASYVFLNSWAPSLMPTVPGVWAVVPGGWSIGVEVTFYLAFPMFAALASNMRRALALFALCVLAGGLANRVAAPLLATVDPAVAVDNFLYFWFPNQMAVFAFGAVLFFAKSRMEQALRPGANDSAVLTRRIAGMVARHGNAVPAFALAVFFASGRLALPHWIGQTSPYLPTMLVATPCLAGFVLALALARRSWFLNPVAAALGRASFSAYLLHFAVIRLVVAMHPVAFHAGATGAAAVAAYAAGWIVVVAVTFAVAWCGYRGLELPMIALGKALLAGRQNPALQLR